MESGGFARMSCNLARRINQTPTEKEGGGDEEDEIADANNKCLKIVQVLVEGKLKNGVKGREVTEEGRHVGGSAGPRISLVPVSGTGPVLLARVASVCADGFAWPFL
jgi:hypothetical protein